MNAIIAVPKLYTQVLHLMNKMNLPAPFGPVTKTPSLVVILSHIFFDELNCEFQRYLLARYLSLKKQKTSSQLTLSFPRNEKWTIFYQVMNLSWTAKKKKKGEKNRSFPKSH